MAPTPALCEGPAIVAWVRSLGGQTVADGERGCKRLSGKCPGDERAARHIDVRAGEALAQRGQVDQKARTAPELTLDPYSAIVIFHDVFGD